MAGLRTWTRWLRLTKRLEPERREAILAAVASDSVWSTRFFILLTLSTIIASLGLVSNSAAVVIGAMIIAPLMGPILGVALASVSGATSLQRTALIVEFIGVALVVFLGFLVGQVPFTLGISSEMLARTAPTTYDIVIAVACGLAGGYGSVNPKANAAAGVAISVALVPPLSSCGLLLAHGELRLAFGALLLFAANFFSIQLAASLVFVAYGFTGVEYQKRGRLLVRLLPSIIGVVVVGCFLTVTLIQLFSDRKLDEAITRVLSDQVARRSGGRLEEILLRSETQKGYSVVARVLTPRPFTQQQVRQIEEELRRSVRSDIELVLRSVVSEDMAATGRVFLTQTEVSQATAAEEQAKLYELFAETLREGLANHEGAALDDMERDSRSDGTLITAVVRTPTPIEPSEVQDLERLLQTRTGVKARLIVRSVSTRDADRDGLLFQPEKPRVDTRIASIQNRLRPILGRRLGALGARLQNIGVTPREGRFRVQVTLQSPQSLPSEALASISSDVRKFVDYRLDLGFRTELVFRP